MSILLVVSHWLLITVLRDDDDDSYFIEKGIEKNLKLREVIPLFCV